jgi:hypothetical protein
MTDCRPLPLPWTFGFGMIGGMEKRSLLFSLVLVGALSACEPAQVPNSGQPPATDDSGDTGSDGGEEDPNGGGDPPDAGEIPDAGEPPDSGPPPDAGEAPDSGEAPDAGPPPPDAGEAPADAGGPTGQPNDCSGSSTQLLFDTFGSESGLVTGGLGSTDVPGEGWNELGNAEATRENGSGAFIIERGSALTQDYAGAYTDHNALGNVGAYTYRIRAMFRPGNTTEAFGNVVRFLIQAGNEAPEAFRGVGMELTARNPGVVRIVDQANSNNRTRASTSVGLDVLEKTQIYAMEVCMSATKAKITLREDGYGGLLLSETETNENLIPEAQDNPLFRIEGYSEHTGVDNIEILEVELARMD